MFEKKTELKAQLNLAVQELLSCEAKIRDIMTKSRIGILVVDREGATRFANSFAAAIFDCAVEELLGYQFKFPIVLDATKEVKLKSRSGRTMTAETWEIEIEWEGKPAYLVFLHDVTERVQKEQELRKLYRAITESPSIVMITDANGIIEYVNPKFTEVTGYTPAEVIGKNPRFLRSGKMPQELYEELWETILAGREWRGEMFNRKKNGEFYWEYAAISPIKGIEGNITNFVAVTEDITERKRAEEMFRGLLESAPDAMVIVDGNGETCIVNSQTEELFGYKRAELYGQKVEMLIPERFRSSHVSHREEYFLKPRVRQLGSVEELYGLHKDGHEFPVDISLSPLSTDEGVLVIAAVRDITERKQAEEALRFSEARYRALFRDNPIMIVTLDADWTMLTVNPTCASQLGYAIDELEGESVLKLFHEDDHPAVAEQLRMCLQNPDHVYHWQFRKVRKGGEALWVEEMAQVVYDLNGTINLLVVCQDITERKLTEEALQESEERFRATFNQAAVGIGHVAPDGRWLVVNQKYCDITGYTEEELKSLTIREITHPDDLDTSMKHFQLLLDGKLGNYSLEKRYIRKDGSAVWVNLTASAVTDAGGNPKFLVGVVEDISARKQAEEEIEKLNTDLAARAAELESANLELEAFGYSVSHDLRKPLTVINSYCQVILEMCGTSLDEQCRAYLKEIYDGTLRMNRLIDALLNFSRLSHCEIKPETVDLSVMAGHITDELRAAEPERRVSFAIAEGVTADGDPTLLRVVLDNLLGNAWKYTGAREEAVIEFGVTEVEGQPACFVRDNGAGFDMAYAEKLFIPFQRLPGADEFRGHGIGLATVERIIRRHGGRLWAEGEPGKGAIFWFTLPSDSSTRDAFN